MSWTLFFISCLDDLACLLTEMPGLQPKDAKYFGQKGPANGKDVASFMTFLLLLLLLLTGKQGH